MWIRRGQNAYPQNVDKKDVFVFLTPPLVCWSVTWRLLISSPWASSGPQGTRGLGGTIPLYKVTNFTVFYVITITPLP